MHIACKSAWNNIDVCYSVLRIQHLIQHCMQYVIIEIYSIQYLYSGTVTQVHDCGTKTMMASKYSSQ